MPWWRHDGDRIVVAIHAQPGAKRTEVQGLHGDALKIRIAAPPVDGRANEELRQFLADAFAVPLRDVALLSGASARAKRFAIHGSAVDPATLLKAR